MNEIVQQLTSKLGIGADQAETGLGALLGAIKKEAPAGDFGALLEAVPGASGWLEKAPTAGDGGGGGGLLGKATSLLGGAGAGGITGLIGTLAKSGLDVGKAKEFIPMALALIKEKAGPAVFGKITESVPFLKDALGGGGGLAGKLGSMLGGD